MSEVFGETDRLRRHLLSESSEEERQELERAVLEDDELFERMEAAEDDLIDQYVHGELNEDETRRIASLVESSPRLRAKEETTLAFETWQAGPLVESTTNAAAPKQSLGFLSFRQLALAAAITTALLLAVWLLMQTAALKVSAGTLTAENQALRERVEALEKTVSQLEDSNRSLARRLARSEAEDR